MCSSHHRLLKPPRNAAYDAALAERWAGIGQAGKITLYYLLNNSVKLRVVIIEVSPRPTDNLSHRSTF
jgi:hypothetical protein